MGSQDTADWHRHAAERDAAYLAQGPVDDTETTDGPWSGGPVAAGTYDYADHPYEFDGTSCTCGRPFEEHEEAIR